VNNSKLVETEQESRAVARKPRDTAAVLFSLKFADNIHYKFKSIAKLRKPGFRAPTYRRKTECNAKCPFRSTGEERGGRGRKCRREEGKE